MNALAGQVVKQRLLGREQLLDFVLDELLVDEVTHSVYFVNHYQIVQTLGIDFLEDFLMQRANEIVNIHDENDTLFDVKSLEYLLD